MMQRHIALIAKACVAGMALVAGSAWNHPDGSSGKRLTVLAQAVPASPSGTGPVLQTGTLRVATYAGFPPLIYREEGSNTIIGLEIELARAIAADLKVGAEFSDTPFEGIIPGLLAKRFDVAIADIGDTPARQQQVDFVDYALSFSSIVVPKGNPGQVFSLDDLCGKPIATQTASLQSRMLGEQSDKCVAAGKPPVQVLQVPNEAQIELNLKTRRTVAQVRDYVLGAYEAEHSDGQLEVVSTPSGPARVGASALVGIAVPKGNPELVAALKHALEHIIANGQYGAILAKYNLQSLALDHVTVNTRPD